MTLHPCPVCGKDDKISAKDEPRFYKNGRLTAICFHGHGNGRPRVFDAETGSALPGGELQPWERLYSACERSSGRGIGAAFLAEHCGIFQVTKRALEWAGVAIPTEAQLNDIEAAECVCMAAPMFSGASFVGLEIRSIEAKSAKGQKWVKFLGTQGVYIANPRVQPELVIVMEGVWDCVNAAWDAFNNQALERYAFVGIKAGTTPQMLKETVDVHFPGVPRVLISDQDSAGKASRKRLFRVAEPAILQGVGQAKDYREADPKLRWEALQKGVNAAMETMEARATQSAMDETGSRLIARRAFDGATQAKEDGMRDLEAWRFGQRCAGICKAPTGGKKYYSIRARVHGRAPVAEGLHEFEPLLGHPAYTRLAQDFPSLASIITGGPTESPMSPEWVPPSFLEDGRHWTEIPKDERTAYARVRGWEPWSGKEVGAMQLADLPTFLERMRSAYLYVRIPGSPDSEVGLRVTAFCLAGALTALWAEERWHSGKPMGFLPIEWFFGGPGSGKGTATKIMAMLASGDPKTHGSQRFDGQQGGWLTESVLHGPICFRDELDQYLTEVELEDMKAYTSGEPLQLRKKFGTDMTIAPRPVVFSSNALKVNQDDEATKERIVLIQLDPNPIFTKADRNRAFDQFFLWVENGGGLELIHRVCIGLYRQFRALPMGHPRWTRSGTFDTAMDFVGKVLGIDAASIMALAQEMKEDAITKGARWHRNTRDYLTHEIASGQMIVGSRFEALAHEVWGIQVSDENQVRKFRNWLDEFRNVTKDAPLRIAGFEIKPGPKSKSTKQMIEFEYTGAREGAA